MSRTNTDREATRRQSGRLATPVVDSERATVINKPWWKDLNYIS